MVLRLSAAICGVGVICLCSSVALARSKICADHSCAVDRAAVSTTIVGTASMYNPFDPDIEREAQRLPQASAMSRLRGRLLSR
jgi:hypothetical protein